VLRPSDPAAQLIEIRQPKAVGTIDDDGVGIRNIESTLNDRGTDEHVDFSCHETLHDRFEFVCVHLPMAEFDPRFRAKLCDPIAHALDRQDAIVQEVNLALAFQLAIDCVADDALVVPTNDGLDREAIERRRFDRRHVFYPD